MSEAQVVAALHNFDTLYPQDNGDSALLQLQIQLANPLPFDLDEVNLAEYKALESRWHDWAAVKEVCRSTAELIFDQVVGRDSVGGDP